MSEPGPNAKWKRLNFSLFPEDIARLERLYQKAREGGAKVSRSEIVRWALDAYEDSL